MPSFDIEFKSTYYSSDFQINTGIWANVSNEYQLENPQKSVFRVKPLVFVRWPILEILSFDTELKSTYYSSDFRIDTAIWANLSNEYMLENPKSQYFGWNL